LVRIGAHGEASKTLRVALDDEAPVVPEYVPECEAVVLEYEAPLSDILHEQIRHQKLRRR